MLFKNRLPVFILTTALVACTKEAPPTEEVRPVRVLTITSTKAAPSTSFPGEIHARYESPLAFRIPGKILSRDVQLGQTVRAGQALMRLDSADSQLQERAAFSQFERARLDYERTQSLFDRGFVSKANVELVRATFNAAQAQYQLAKNQSSYSVLVAERPGVVVAVSAEAGQFVNAGAPIITIAEGSAREVAISVPESRIEDVRQGTPVTVSLWNRPNSSYNAHIREIAASADALTRTYSARVSFDSPDESVRLGLTSNVQLVGVQESVHTLPLTAIFDQAGHSRVWIVDPTSMRVKARAITVATFNGPKANVRDGIKDGDLVVVAGVHLLHEGDRVRAENSQPNPEAVK